MDRFKNYVDSVSNPARSAGPIMPTADQGLPRSPKALFVGTGGDLLDLCIDDEVTVLFKNVASGTILPVRPIRVVSPGTTASHLVGLY